MHRRVLLRKNTLCHFWSLFLPAPRTLLVCRRASHNCWWHGLTFPPCLCRKIVFLSHKYKTDIEKKKSYKEFYRWGNMRTYEFVAIPACHGKLDANLCLSSSAPELHDDVFWQTCGFGPWACVNFTVKWGEDGIISEIPRIRDHQVWCPSPIWQCLD